MHENKCNLSAVEIRKPTASNAFINCNICSGDFLLNFFFFWHVQQVWEKINKSISFLKTYRINQSFTLGCKTEEGTQEPNKHWQVGQKLNIQMYWPRNSFWVQSKIRLDVLVKKQNIFQQMTFLNVVGAISKDVSQLKHLLAHARCSIFARRSHSVKTGDLSNINVCFNNCALKFHRSPNGPLGPPWSSDLSFWDSSELFSQILFSKSLSLPQIVLTLCSARRTATLWGEMDVARPPATRQDDRWNHQRDKESTFPRGTRRLSWYCPVTWGRRHKVQSNFKSGGYGFLFFLNYTSCFFGWRTSWMVSEACGLRKRNWAILWE